MTNKSSPPPHTSPPPFTCSHGRIVPINFDTESAPVNLVAPINLDPVPSNYDPAPVNLDSAPSNLVATLLEHSTESLPSLLLLHEVLFFLFG